MISCEEEEERGEGQKEGLSSWILMSINHTGSPQDVTSEKEDPPSPPPDLQAS